MNPVTQKKIGGVMLEKMGALFEVRLDGDNEYLLSNIESAREFHPFAAWCLL